jgi:hypothetical protein
MKALRNIAAILLVSASLAACTGDRNKATLGGTKDTTAVAGSDNPNNLHAADSANKDSIGKGNADPAGHGLVDTSNKRPVH